MIEKKYIAIVGLAAVVLATSACMRNAPVNDSENASETSVSDSPDIKTAHTSFTFDSLTDHYALLHDA